MMPRNPRQARRLMERMGMQVETISDVKQVIIKTKTRDVVIDQPEVTLTRIQGQDIYQVIGGKISEVENPENGHQCQDGEAHHDCGQEVFSSYHPAVE